MSYLEEPSYLDPESARQVRDIIAALPPQDVRGLGSDPSAPLPEGWVQLPLVGIAVRKQTLVILGILALIAVVYMLMKQKKGQGKGKK